MDSRVIFYHKQATSARTRFLKFNSGTVCAFDPLPMPASVLDEDNSTTINHPAAILKDAEKRLALPEGSLKAQGEYHQMVDVPGDQVQIILSEITTIDPPFEEAEQAGASFIDLTQARGLPSVELELLRSAYELVLGG
jgi:hypothetical protein